MRILTQKVTDLEHWYTYYVFYKYFLIFPMRLISIYRISLGHPNNFNNTTLISWNERDIFESSYIQSVLSVYALMVFKVFQNFSLSYTIINCLFASLNLITNFENAYWNPPLNFLLCSLFDVLQQDKSFLSLIISWTRKQKVVKTISVSTESNYEGTKF